MSRIGEWLWSGTLFAYYTLIYAQTQDGSSGTTTNDQERQPDTKDDEPSQENVSNGASLIQLHSAPQQV